MNDAAHDDTAILEDLMRELLTLRADIVNESAAARARVGDAHANHKDSAWNLLNYLALRRRDLRPLQQRLAARGLSSLGRSEPHVLATIDAVLAVLRRVILPAHARPPHGPADGYDVATGQALLTAHTHSLLGPARPERNVRIMVTMPGAAADDYQFVHDLLQQGMDCVRINCAHDDEATWLRIIEHVRAAERALHRSCKVAMDLAGPKLRTGAMAPGPAVLKIRPQRDAHGHVTAPARLWLCADNDSPPPGPDWALVPAPWLARLGHGDLVHFIDARDSTRCLTITDVQDDGCWAESVKTAYLTPATVLRHSAAPGDDHAATVIALPPRAGVLRLQQGDILLLTRDPAPGRPAHHDDQGQVVHPASIGCTLPQVFADLRAGEPVWFDDGKLGGLIEQVAPDQVRVRITHAGPKGGKLRADKGINLPDSALRLPALTAKDRADLAFVARHADIVQLSFPNTADDVAALQAQLAQKGHEHLGVVLKIETQRGFRNLPDLLLTALRSPICGVMIARGDLAVECGFERMAEVQEEILWLCEAAHVPVIWATQVLETLAQQGMPSRAEVTDAAMSDRAECVMLNKGPCVRDAVRVLDNILRRMQEHQSKKRSMLRMLQLAHGAT